MDDPNPPVTGLKFRSPGVPATQVSYSSWSTSSSESQKLEIYLQENIPLTQYMGVKVLLCSPDTVILMAPLEANKNHKGTAFGGSVTALATLCCWAWVRQELVRQKLDAHLVVQTGTTKYIKPVTEALQARCDSPPLHEVATFLKSLRTKGKGRIEISSSMVGPENQVAAQFTGLFAAHLKVERDVEKG